MYRCTVNVSICVHSHIHTYNVHVHVLKRTPSHTHTLTLTHTLSLAHTHGHTHTCTYSLTHTYTHSLSLSLSLSHTHTHTQSGSSVLTTLMTPHAPRAATRNKPRPQQHHQVTSVEGVVTEIIRVFVDAVPHVPGHRRLPLLSHLLLRVGPAHFLSVALGLLVVKHVQQLGVKEQVSVYW